MDYWQYTLCTDAETAEMVMALLADEAFDTFEETPEGLHAYLPAKADADSAEEALSALQEQFSFTWDKTFIPGQNWNEIWESNFHPVVVRDFCAVRADFHPPQPGVRFELVINPKMAFGTGHHETTWMCMDAMETLPMAGANVLDFGCGTGILAILAAKLGAAHLEAIDIEAESYRSTFENATLNGVTNITARCGVLSDVQGRDFDGILANINRNVILESLPTLHRLLRPGGWLLVSGILQTDGDVVTEAAIGAGFAMQHKAGKGNWLSILYLKVQ